MRDGPTPSQTLERKKLSIYYNKLDKPPKRRSDVKHALLMIISNAETP
jgi:hypothetical protein